MSLFDTIRHWLGFSPEASPVASSLRDSGSMAENRAAMETMHQAMNIPLTGDADRDFVTGMIPHHQGAVDMAQVELRHGRDPQLRGMAKEIISAQQKEIGFMRRWLASKDNPATKDR